MTNDRTVFGFWLYIMSDCLLFASLFATFAVLRGATFGGPTPSELFSLPFVFFETMVLLTSSFTVGIAMLLMYEGKARAALQLLLVTLALGLTFVALEIYEFREFILAGHSWRANAFLSSFFGLVGTHGLHVTLGSVWMVVLIAHLLLKGISEGLVRKMLCLTLFWHFLDIIWIFIFTFVYLLGFQ